MLAQSLRTRSAHFAFLFGPPRVIRREEASPIYDKICEHLRIDDFAFQYDGARAPSESQGFKIQLKRKEGRGFFTITIDNPSNKHPIRLLLEYTWPPTLEHVYENFKLAGTAVFEALTGNWQKVFAEVRIRAQCGDRNKDALSFIRNHLLKIRSDWVESLGQPLVFSGCRFQTASRGPIEAPLESPVRDLSIEVLKEDPSCLYFELVSQWPQTPNAGMLPGRMDNTNLRQFIADPSEYVKHEYEFLIARLQELSKMGNQS